MVSEDEWAAIPEVGDARNRKQRNPRAEKFTPLPDSVLSRNLGGESTSTIDPSSGLASMMPGVMTPGMLTPSGSYFNCTYKVYNIMNNHMKQYLSFFFNVTFTLQVIWISEKLVKQEILL